MRAILDSAFYTPLYPNLPAEVIDDLVDTLRYLDREFRAEGSLDAINMGHVTKALARVDEARRANRETVKHITWGY